MCVGKAWSYLHARFPLWSYPPLDNANSAPAGLFRKIVRRKTCAKRVSLLRVIVNTTYLRLRRERERGQGTRMRRGGGRGREESSGIGHIMTRRSMEDVEEGATPTGNQQPQPRQLTPEHDHVAPQGGSDPRGEKG